MKKMILKNLSFAAVRFILSATALLFISCERNELPGTPAQKYRPDVAIAWIKMQQRLFVETPPGLLPHVAGRTYAYTGLTLYESIVPGMRGYQSIASQLNGKLLLPDIQKGNKYHWPASANSAAAFMLKNLLPHSTPALLNAVDSLEADFHTRFQTDADAETLQRSVDFGKQVAAAIFEWSKTDGGHEAYKNPFSDSYIPPTGPGKWVSTGEFPFSQPVYPYWGNNRTFIPGLAEATQPPPPPPYSEQPGSVFYNAVNEIYTMSQNLTREDSMTAKFWGYALLNEGDVLEYNDNSHAANIATQMIMLKKLSLEEAALLYCKQGIAINEGGISCVKTKFHYNLVRPITYIRTILGNSKWNPVIPTPPFPEFTSGHAVISMASASVLEDTFGKNFRFTDHTFDHTYGPRSFDSFEDYAKEAGFSRLQAGIHYRFAMDEGLKQGKKVAAFVNQLRFKK